MNVKSYIKQALTDFGLSEGESRLYLAVLDCLGADAGDLRTKVRMSTAGVYKTISSLLDRGFIEVAANTYPAKYFAVPLEKIADSFSKEGRKLQRVSERFKNLGKLNKISDEAEVYEDNSLTDYYLNIPYKIDDFIWCIGAFGAVKNFLGVDVEKEFIKKRVKKGIHCDALIFDESDESRNIAGPNKGEKRETKFISGYNYPLEFTYLFGDNIVTFYRDYDGKVKVLRTESPELARAKLLQAQMLWKSI